MTKWICKKCKECDPCSLDIGEAKKEPFICPLGCTTPTWNEIKEEPTTNSSQLPKLTAEVFDRPDCPAWAMYAAVDEDGETTFFDKMPYPATKTCGCFLRDCQYETIPSKFDSSDWQNSLIERPAKPLPDWCKVGEWGYDTAVECYFEIVGITHFNVDVAYIGKAWRYNIGRDIFDDNYRPTHLRAFNNKEMEALVGKVLKRNTGLYLVTAYENRQNQVKIEGGWRDADALMRIWTWPTGAPCGVREHLNDAGEWVE